MYLSRASSIFCEISTGAFGFGPPAAGEIADARDISETEPGGNWSGTTCELSTRPPSGGGAALPRSCRCRWAACVRNAVAAASFETVIAGGWVDAPTLMPRPRASGIGG